LGSTRGIARLLAGDDAPDAELLARYRLHRDEAAFGQLVARHARRVRAAAARVLPDTADIDDATQAAFLALVRRADQLDPRSSVGPWLSGVAHRVAVRLRQRNRRAHPLGDTNLIARERPADLSWREACDVLHAELDRLPERYRLPLLLCYLEGKTRDETAAALGLSIGTVKGRVRRGIDMLRRRLERRGVALSAGLLAAVAVPEPLVAGDAALVLAAPSPRASELAKEVTVGTTTWKWLAGVAIVMAMAAGAVVAGGVGQPEPALSPKPPLAVAPAGAPIPEKPDPKVEVKQVLTAFYRNLAAGTAKDNEGFFRSADATVSGVSYFRPTTAWQKKPAEYLKGHGDKPKYLEVDSVEVDLVTPGMAAARVKYRAGGYKGNVVITVLLEDGRWRIASLFETTHFVW
jgi:RNA polymerase sigma factor (sigma-70 family)